jgi:hypothetical protein
MNKPTRIFLLAAFFVGASLAPAARAAMQTDPPVEGQNAAAAQGEEFYAQGN